MSNSVNEKNFRREMLERTKLSNLRSPGKPTLCIACEKSISFDTAETLKTKRVCKNCVRIFALVSAALDAESDKRAKENLLKKLGGNL